MVLLVIFSFGFLGAVDTSSRISGNNEARTAAAALAQEDIERVKALKIRDLANMNLTRTVPVGGVNYSVTTTTQWVDDSTGTTTCPSGATRTDYLKAISVVTWPSMGKTPPVKNQTLIAVPLGTFDDATGGLIAKFIDRDGDGVPNISGRARRGPPRAVARATPTAARSGAACPRAATTSTSHSPATWTLTATTSIHQSGTVSGGATNSFVFSYDRASTISATFQTMVSGVPQADKATDLMVANSGDAVAGNAHVQRRHRGEHDLHGLDAVSLQSTATSSGRARARAPTRGPTPSRHPR